MPFSLTLTGPHVFAVSWLVFYLIRNSLPRRQRAPASGSPGNPHSAQRSQLFPLVSNVRIQLRSHSLLLEISEENNRVPCVFLPSLIVTGSFILGDKKKKLYRFLCVVLGPRLDALCG